MNQTVIPTTFSDEKILALGEGHDALLRAYQRYPEIQREFQDFACFEAYVTSLREGKSSVCDKRGIVRSNIADSKTFPVS